MLLAMLLTSYSLFSQTLTVRDKTTLHPIENAMIKHKTGTLLTTPKGQATLDFIADTDSIYVSAQGFQTGSYTGASLKSNHYLIHLSEVPYSINEVVVSASRFEEKKSDVPQQIMVINAKELQFMNQQTSADVLQNTGNVFVQKSQLGGGSPVMRGFEANKVLIVVDGVRMNNAIFRGGHLQNIISMDNAVLDRTEVVFGPGSVVYGSDALGGVMHFYTRKPLLSYNDKLHIKVNAFTRYSTASNEKTGHINLNLGTKRIAFLTGFTFSDFGDLRQGNIRNPFYGAWGKREFYAERIAGVDSMVRNSDLNVQKGSGYSQYDILQKILVKQNNKVTHLFNFQYSSSSDINRYDRLTEISSGKLRFAQWYYGPQKRLLGSYQLSIQSANPLFTKANIILAYQDIEESRHDRRFNNNNLNHRNEKVMVYSLNADFEKDLGKHELRYGAEFFYNKVNSAANRVDITTGLSSPLDTRYPDGGSIMQTAAAYLTHSWEINKYMVLSDGIRYSNILLNSSFNDTTFFPFPFSEITQKSSAINGNLGLTVMPGKDWQFSVVLSTGFRAPNVDDVAKVFDSQPGSVVVPNPDLKPEYIYNGEFTVSKIISGKIKVEGTGYYSVLTDALSLKSSTFNGSDSIVYSGVKSAVMTTMNANEAYIYGYSMGVMADITNAFSISSTINYTYGRIKTDSTDYPLDHIPPVFGRTGFNLKIKKFRGEFFLLYNGWKYMKDYNLGGEDNQQYATINGTPAWYTLNLRTAYYLNKHIQVQAALDNMLDTNYRVFASGISAPGRNFVITLRGSF